MEIQEDRKRESGRYIEFRNLVRSALGYRKIRGDPATRRAVKQISSYFDISAEDVLLGREPGQMPEIDSKALENIVGELNGSCYLDSTRKQFKNDGSSFDNKVLDLLELIVNANKKIAPNDPDVYYFSAIFKFEHKRFEEALMDIDKCIKLDSENTLNYFCRATIKHNLDRDEEAIVDLDKAIELDPKEQWIYFSRGIALENQGHPVKAKQDYRTVLKLSGEIPSEKLEESDIMCFVRSTRRLRRLGPKKDRVTLKEKMKQRIAKYKQANQEKED